MQYKLQINNKECGIWIIQNLYKYYFNKWLNIHEIKNKAKYDEQGISIFNLIELAQEFNIKCKALEGNFDLLKEVKINEPVISIIKANNFFHYILILKITNKNNVIYFDPLIGKQKMPIEEFKKIYLGIIIQTKKKVFNKSIINNNEINFLKIDFLKERIYILIFSILTILASLISSYYIKIVLDQLAFFKQINSLLKISFLFVALTVIKIALNILNEFMMDKIETKYQIHYMDLYVKKLESIKWNNLYLFNETTHLKNIEILSKLANFNSRYLFNLVTQFFCLFISSILLVLINLKIFIITIFFSFVLIFISFIYQKKLIKLEKESFYSSLKTKEILIALFSDIKNYKLNLSHKIINSNYKNLKDNLITKIQHKMSASISWYDFAKNSLNNLVPFVIIVIAINDTWNNQMSLGQIFLFLTIFNYFLSPLSTFTSLIINYPIMKDYQNEINSFMLKEDEIINNEKTSTIEKIKKIELKNIKFAYQENKIFNFKSLVIDSKINLCGKNGSGKTTLLKILSTLISEKNFYINDKNIENYNLDLLRKKIIYINSNEYLSGNTIFQYLNNENNTNNYLINNLNKYDLTSLLAKLNLSLTSKIFDGGNNFSAGQKQLIALLKIFSNDFDLILLDEAFENIDKNILNQIFKILRKHLNSKIVVEISHQKNYLFCSKEVNCENLK